jgi:hypothetical protein
LGWKETAVIPVVIDEIDALIKYWKNIKNLPEISFIRNYGINNKELPMHQSKITI